MMCYVAYKCRWCGTIHEILTPEARMHATLMQAVPSNRAGMRPEILATEPLSLTMRCYCADGQIGVADFVGIRQVE